MTRQALHPVAGVHAVAIGPDLVALDLNTDGYVCFPGLAEHLHQAGGSELRVDDPGVADDLVASGLYSVGGAVMQPVRTTPPPRRTSRHVDVSRGRPTEAFQLAGAVLHSRRTFGRRSLKQLVADGGRAALTRGGSDEDAARRAVLFERWLPWAPGQGLCLYRAYTLRRFLRAGGVDADWVFGVRTWPFSAHCWLQRDDLLLDDDLDRVGLYTPILVA